MLSQTTVLLSYGKTVESVSTPAGTQHGVVWQRPVLANQLHYVQALCNVSTLFLPFTWLQNINQLTLQYDGIAKFFFAVFWSL